MNRKKNNNKITQHIFKDHIYSFFSREEPLHTADVE